MARKLQAGVQRPPGRVPARARADGDGQTALYLYVPVRYYHRPRGIDDAHGYGKPSRFLTDDVQRTCEIIRSDDVPDRFERLGDAPRKIGVSVDALFR